MSTLLIDDQDPSLVKYAGTGWVKGGTSHEHDGTVTSSTTVGDSFTVTFSGSNIGVYGTLDSTSGGVVTSYSIDGAPEAQVTSTAGSGDTYQQQFWQSPQLEAKEHNLVVKVVKVNPSSDPGEGTIWFDYFQVTEATTQTTASFGASSASVSKTTSIPTSTPSGDSSGFPTPIPTKKKSIAPTVGGVVAGILLLLLAAAVILFVLRRRRRTANSNATRAPKTEIDESFAQTPGYMPLPHGNSQASITPALHGPGGVQTNQSHNYRPPPPASIPRSSMSSYSVPAGQSVLYYQIEAQRSSYDVNRPPVASIPGPSATSTTVPSRPSISKDSKSANPSLTMAWMPEPVQHVDSGLRVVNPLVDVKPEELPPVYSAQ